jgi:superfamily I DNA/RNA helicase
MTSKEALKDISYLILQEVDNLKYKDLWKEALNTIKQDLERLEALEKENQELNDVIEKYNHLNVQSFFIRDREREENEKLKKAFEILKNKTKIKAYPFANRLSFENGCTRYEYKLTQQEYDLLKEVLGDV